MNNKQKDIIKRMAGLVMDEVYNNRDNLTYKELDQYVQDMLEMVIDVEILVPMTKALNNIKDLIKNQKDIPFEFIEIIDKNFWDLI